MAISTKAGFKMEKLRDWGLSSLWQASAMWVSFAMMTSCLEKEYQQIEDRSMRELLSIICSKDTGC